MATPQIEQLRQQFNNMNNTQKKEFIESLEKKVQGKNNSEYTKFLKECIQNYNSLVKEGSNGINSTISNKSSTNLKSENQSNKNNKKSYFLMAIAILLSFMIFTVGGVGLFLVWDNNQNKQSTMIFENSEMLAINPTETIQDLETIDTLDTLDSVIEAEMDTKDRFNINNNPFVDYNIPQFSTYHTLTDRTTFNYAYDSSPPRFSHTYTVRGADKTVRNLKAYHHALQDAGFVGGISHEEIAELNISGIGYAEYSKNLDDGRLIRLRIRYGSGNSNRVTVSFTVETEEEINQRINSTVERLSDDLEMSEITKIYTNPSAGIYKYSITVTNITDQDLDVDLSISLMHNNVEVSTIPLSMDTIISPTTVSGRRTLQAGETRTYSTIRSFSQNTQEYSEVVLSNFSMVSAPQRQW